MSKVIHKFNNDSKSWKINAYNLASVTGDNLNLTASDNKNIYLNVSGGLVNTTYLDISNNLRVYGNAVFANDLQTDNSSVKIPNTYNNYAFVSHTDLLSNLTKTGNTWIDLSGSGYIVNYSPLSNNSKVFLHGKISYIASTESEQLISFQLLRVINGTETVLFSDMSFGSVFGTIQNGIYNFDYVDSPDSSANITYYLKYHIYDDGNNIDTSSGVIGYDSNNINCFMAQELYIPSMDGIIQTVNTSLGNVFLDNRDASFNNVDISGTLNASNSNNAIKYSSHLIPTSNDTFDIGSAEYKVRDLYVADNSIFIGDKSKLGIDETGGLIIMERDSEIIPSGIYDGVTKIEEPANVLNDVNNKLGTDFTVLSEIKLEDWQKFSNILTTNANIPQKNMNQIYKPTTRNDWKSQKKIANLLNEYSDASFGNIDISGTLNVDTITENTDGSGITIGTGINITGTNLTNANIISAQNFNIASVNVISAGRQATFRDIEMKDSGGQTTFLALGNSGDISTNGSLYVSTIKGPANMIIDPAAHNDETGNVIIRGNLEVKGDTTTINSTTVDISDNRIRLNAAEASTDAGIDISFTDGTSKQFIYSKTDSEWKTNDTSFNIGTGDFTGKNIKISNKVIFYSD
tara:strand:+ start:22 stop:1917 length:1896 start_codon:yes stop_codon:yes gene_type:complete